MIYILKYGITSGVIRNLVWGVGYPFLASIIGHYQYFDQNVSRKKSFGRFIPPNPP